MDLFIRKELTVLGSGTELENVVSHCIKLLTWLRACQEEIRSQHCHLELNQTVVESLLKAHIYLFECYDRFGESLADRCDSNSFFEGCSSAEDRKQCIRELCRNIVNTRKGEAHAPILYLLHRTFAEIQPAWSVIRDLDWSEIRKSDTLNGSDLINPDLHQMRRLVKRICRLSSFQHMQIALKRSLVLVGFQVWLNLFQELRESEIHSDCHLVRHMICDILTEGETPTSSAFLHNIYLFVSQSANKVRFWACLEHVRLPGSLIAYLTGHWSRYLPYIDLDEMQMTAEAPIAQVPLNEAIYVTHLMLVTGSPCRREFSHQLRTLLSAKSWALLLELLNKVAFVFS
ncbi:uncharacterized protein LOC108110093 [Drosophila eugracilis]|uniref:uncharacterized protein LOC108110093 n=1 Tax=Drosophila eugracilis TaxID=29029 RepID=UPI0007E799EB|nr:uncharacterized protein LOC108110093 [Drosophila eugracilis]